MRWFANMTLKRFCLFLFAIIASASLAFAQEPRAQGESALDFSLDPENSSVSAKVAFFGLASKTARFPEMEGSATIVPGKPEAARIDVTFDATALEAPDSVTLSRLRGEKFFWVEKYPTIRFTSESLELTSATSGVLKGQLTARGVSQPTILDVEFDQDPLASTPGLAIHFTAKTTINRRDYGMKSYRFLVGNTVKITMRIAMLPR